MHLNNVVTIEIKNIIIENKYYEYDCDDTRYVVNDKIKSINKKYIHVYNNISNLNYELEDFLEEIGKEYCNGLLDTTLDDIIIYCDVTIYSLVNRNEPAKEFSTTVFSNRGHDYLLVDTRHGVCVIHAKSCPCNNKKIPKQ